MDSSSRLLVPFVFEDNEEIGAREEDFDSLSGVVSTAKEEDMRRKAEKGRERNTRKKRKSSKQQ
jgi:hypothetical protein